MQIQSLEQVRVRAEYDHILFVLKETSFNKKKTAEILKIDRKTLYNKLNEYQRLKESLCLIESK